MINTNWKTCTLYITLYGQYPVDSVLCVNSSPWKYIQFLHMWTIGNCGFWENAIRCNLCIWFVGGACWIQKMYQYILITVANAWQLINAFCHSRVLNLLYSKYLKALYAFNLHNSNTSFSSTGSPVDWSPACVINIFSLLETTLSYARVFHLYSLVILKKYHAY